MNHRTSVSAVVSTFALAWAAVFASGASAAIVTGTVADGIFEGHNNGMYSFHSSDLTYANGDAYSSGTVALLCLTAWADTPSGAVTLDASVGSMALVGGGGELGIAGINYLIDNYYNSYVVNGSSAEQWSFQQALWELGTDFNGSMESFDAYSGNGDPSYYTGYPEPEYANAWQAVYADLGETLPTLDTNYRSDKYSIDFFEGVTTSSVQNLVSVQGLSPVPVPAALPLVLSGLAAMGFLARRKRR